MLRPSRRADSRLTYDMLLWLRLFGLTFAVALPSMLVIEPMLSDLFWLVGIAIVVACAVVGGPALLRGRFPRLAAVWPAFVTFIGLGYAGWVATGIGPLLGGFYTITYVYVGLTRRPGTTVKLVPLGTGSWLLANAPLTPLTLAKLPLVAVVWVVLGELIARISAERAAHQRTLAEMASRDALTGLLNRYGLEDRLRAMTEGDALVFLDLDHFKRVNDELGHAAGDEVLADFGRVILAVKRPRDRAIRYGGEEILLFLPATDRAGVDSCLARLRMGWSASHPEITFSAGAATIGKYGVIAAFAAADAALYRAKDAGRNCTVHAPEVPNTAEWPKQRRAVTRTLETLNSVA